MIRRRIASFAVTGSSRTLRVKTIAAQAQPGLRKMRSNDDVSRVTLESEFVPVASRSERNKSKRKTRGLSAGVYLSRASVQKFFVSTDRLESEAYRVLQPDDVFDLAVRNGLHFDHTTQTGAVFHMMTTLGRHGLIGLTAVGDSREQARSIFDRTRDAFDREARAASKDRDLPAVG